MTLPLTSVVCQIEPFRYQATPQPIGDQSASSNQINEQHLEDYLARLRTAMCDDIQAIIDNASVPVNPFGGRFIDLSDVPNNYTGDGGKAVAVKLSQDGLEFVPFPTPVLEPTPLTNRLICLIKPNTGTTLAASSLSIVGQNQVVVTGSTLSHPVPSNANVLSGAYRVRINGANTANSTAAIRQNVGSVLGFGGWRMVARWGAATALAQQRFFVGLINQTGVIANVNPSTLTDLVGFSYDSAQANLFFIHNDNAGAATTVNLGGGFPVNGTSFYEMEISMSPGSGVVNYRILNVGTGATASSSVNTNLPADATLLNLYIWLNGGTTSGVVSLDTQDIYLELFK